MKEMVTIIKGLADGSRLRTLAALAEAGELCVCQIIELLDLSPATVSQHMSILQNAGLVESRKKGRWVYYRVCCEAVKSYLAPFLEELKKSPEVVADRSRLDGIVACGPEAICRKRRGATGAEMPSAPHAAPGVVPGS